jgi:thioredoxin-related protein
MKTIFLISLFLTSFVSDWQTDFAKAQTEATENQKFIVVNFSGSDWCAPCIRMKKEIFESEVFQKYATDQLVLVRADFPRLKKNQLDKKLTAQNEALAERYNQQGAFPLTVLVDAQGKVLKAWDGFPKSATPESFTHEIKEVIDAHNAKKQ